MLWKKLQKSAYAKINLGLDVLGKRADGYHEVSMVMQSISLADTVTLEKHSRAGCANRPQRFAGRQQQPCV